MGTGGQKPSSNYTGTETAANLNSSNAMSVTVKALWCQNVFNFDYTGNVQTFDSSDSCGAGHYKLEVWGANGGRGRSASQTELEYRNGGRGGYSYGTIVLGASTTLYVYVGQKGIDEPCTTYGCINASTWNGGGEGSNRSLIQPQKIESGGAGGGATDISIQGTANSTTWNEQKHLYSRLIVAGGGGGGDGHHTCTPSDALQCIGGYGGGTGGEGRKSYAGSYSYGATQLGGGKNCSYSGTSSTSCTAHYTPKNESGFGYGGGGRLYQTQDTGNWYVAVSGGGGGWYGGGGMGFGPAGGGSGWVYTASTYSYWAANSTEGKSGNWLLNSSYYLASASTIDGNQTFKSPSGINETGHSGNGYARITWIGDTI